MNIYCIGIGGIGLSALARYYKHQGHNVSGSDASSSALIESLKQEGMDICPGVNVSRITKDIDMVVYTIAISENHQEFVRANELGLLCKTYPQALGDVTKDKKTIAVCGTHGKTTTTAMAYYAFKACGVNPTVIVGSVLSDIGSNFVPGDSDYMIVEACEYKRSFLNLYPSHVIITNIEEDHLDYYKNLEDIEEAFESFIDKVPQEGYVVTHGDVTIHTHSKHISVDAINTGNIELQVLGKHNQSNAQLVLTLGRALGFSEESLRLGLKQFKGTWRRLEYKGVTKKGVKVYDDYGHHPTEIKATIEALHDSLGSKVPMYVFFQPHLFSRTKIFLQGFADAFITPKKVYILPIFAAREVSDETISSSMLVEKINNLGGSAEFLSEKESISKIVESLEGDAIVLNIGAGDAYSELNKISFI